MSILKTFALAVCVALLTVTIQAEEAKPEAPKTDATPEAPKPDAPKTDAAAAELPKPPEGISPTNANASESLVGELHKGPALNAKGKAKKKGNGNPDAIVLAVSAEGEKKGKGMKNARQVTLVASGDLLTQLTTLADKNAHVKVSGSVNGDTMTVKEVNESPVEAKTKKKKKDNA